MKSTLPAAIAATLLALIATAAPASANVTNPADNPHKITVTGDDGRTYVDGQDTLPGYDDEECTYIPGAWFDFDNNRVRYPDGQSIPWTEWERATGYNEWLAKKAAGTPVNTTAPTEPVNTTAPTKPVSTTSPTKPGSTTSPTKPGSTTSPTKPGSTTSPTKPGSTSGGSSTVPTGQVTASGTSGSTSHAGGSVSTAPSGGNVASPSSAGTGTADGAGANQDDPESTALPSFTAFAADEPGEGSSTGGDNAGSEVLAQGASGAGANSGTNSGSAAGLAILGSLFGAIGLAFGGYAFVKSGRRTPPVVGA